MQYNILNYCYQCRRLQSCGLDPWVGKSPWRRKWQPTTVLLPGKFPGQRRLLCYSPWAHKESDTLTNWSFWTVVLEKTLESPLTAKRSNQSILKEISPGYSLEGLMLKLKLQHSGHLMWRADSFEKTLMLGKIEGRRRRGRQKKRWLNGITD